MCRKELVCPNDGANSCWEIIIPCRRIFPPSNVGSFSVVNGRIHLKFRGFGFSGKKQTKARRLISCVLPSRERSRVRFETVCDPKRVQDIN